MQEERLFSRQLFSKAAAERRNSLSMEIAQLKGLLNDDQIASLMRKYMFHFPVIHFDRAGIAGEVREVYHLQRRHDAVWGDEFVDVDEAFLRFEVSIPFEGDGSVLLLCPTIFYREAEGLDAHVHGKQICMRYEIRKSERKPDLKDHYQDDLGMLERLIMNLRHDADIYNGLLPKIIRDLKADLAKV